MYLSELNADLFLLMPDHAGYSPDFHFATRSV